MAELVPRVWGLCEQAARANINLTIDAEEVDRLELSLEVFEALAAKVASIARSGAALAGHAGLPDARRWN
jgi:proline dehydrogenase